jgi:hypothetical protein
VQSQSRLPEIVSTLNTSRRFPRRLHRRQQQGDQDANDRDDDQKFDKRKTV